MNRESCKKCKYYKAYYHGNADFSYRCMWTLKAPENVAETECNKTNKE